MMIRLFFTILIVFIQGCASSIPNSQESKGIGLSELYKKSDLYEGQRVTIEGYVRYLHSDKNIVYENLELLSSTSYVLKANDVTEPGGMYSFGDTINRCIGEIEKTPISTLLVFEKKNSIKSKNKLIKHNLSGVLVTGIFHRKEIDNFFYSYPGYIEVTDIKLLNDSCVLAWGLPSK